jgi:hypothetical protein
MKVVLCSTICIRLQALPERCKSITGMHLGKMNTAAAGLGRFPSTMPLRVHVIVIVGKGKQAGISSSAPTAPNRCGGGDTDGSQT